VRAGRGGGRVWEETFPGGEVSSSSCSGGLLALVVATVCCGVTRHGEPRELGRTGNESGSSRSAGTMGAHPRQLCQRRGAKLGTRLHFRIVTVLLNWLSGSLCKASSAS